MGAAFSHYLYFVNGDHVPPYQIPCLARDPEYRDHTNSQPIRHPNYLGVIGSFGFVWMEGPNYPEQLSWSGIFAILAARFWRLYFCFPDRYFRALRAWNPSLNARLLVLYHAGRALFILVDKLGQISHLCNCNTITGHHNPEFAQRSK